MAITQYYVDPARAGEGNVGTGTIGDPYSDLQYALNTITRNATDGDQINIKAGTAEVLGASLTLATFGTPTAVGPLVLRGYTAAANDDGKATIDCGGFAMFASAYATVILADLICHSFGNNQGVTLGANCVVFRCELHKGASSPAVKVMLQTGASSSIVGCYIHDIGTGAGSGFYTTGTNCILLNNYINIGTAVGAFAMRSSVGVIVGNVIVCGEAGQQGIGDAYPLLVLNNTVYNSTAGTTRGIYLALSVLTLPVLNNIVMGWSGAGGDGIEALNLGPFGYNAFYNNTNPITMTDQKFVDLTSHDVTLGASPFTNAAGGDFSVSTALKALGFLSLLGAATNAYVDIGAAQRQEAGGGAVSISPFRGNF